MLNAELIRSWKDPLSRVTGTDHPAGTITLDDAPPAGLRARILAGKASSEQNPFTLSLGNCCRDIADSGDDEWWDW
ncbi:hypothetical protein [Longispora urticae]